METIYQCNSQGREDDTVVVDMDGALLINPSSFPYFALIAFDVGGILRLGLLLVVAPVAWLLHHFISESAGMQVLMFATFAGVKVSDIESAAKVVLPKHYSEDLHQETWRVVSSCGKKCVVTMNPRVMVEPFLKNYLDVDLVLGTEISSVMGIATGFVASPKGLMREEMVKALKKTFKSTPNVGIGRSKGDFPFLNLCKEGYLVSSKPGICPVNPADLPKPVIFHDGRLVQKPTPLIALLIVLWFPIGIFLSILRVLGGAIAPFSYFYYTMYLLGCKIKVKGTPFANDPLNSPKTGVLVVCSHRCVLDSLFVSSFLGSKTVALTYSVSRLSEFLSPIKNCRLTRDRSNDSMIIKQILDGGWNLVMCPEGTTCREPYLLRFSSLFAELTDQILPVAVSIKADMFHGSTARGHKWLDIFFFFMNPFPVYEITFLNKLSTDETCSAGLSSYEVANNIQEMIGKALKFKTTNLTRKDKYQMLAGTNGLVG